MKRILQVVGTMDRAGAETMVMSLYRAIDKSKYQFDFVYFTDKTCAYDDEILALGGRIFRIPSEYANKPLLRTYKLYKIIKNNGFFDAIHCHQLFSNGFHLLASRFAGVKKRIAHSHNTSDVNSKTLIGKTYQFVLKSLINRLATDFIACGNAAGKFLFFPDKNIIFIPNAVDVSKFLNVKDAINPNFFNTPSITKNTIVISQIGRLMPVKNVEFSIDFAKFMKENNIDFHLFFAGAGYLEHDLKKRVAAHNLKDVITFLGVRSDIEKILGHSDVLLMPSFHEGFPVILVEAQAAGTCAIISDRISKEVDLGLDLVQFCSLEDAFSTWLTEMKNIIGKTKINADKRHDILKKHGFDIHVSVKLLEKVYSN